MELWSKDLEVSMPRPEVLYSILTTLLDFTLNFGSQITVASTQQTSPNSSVAENDFKIRLPPVASPHFAINNEPRTQ